MVTVRSRVVACALPTEVTENVGPFTLLRSLFAYIKSMWHPYALSHLRLMSLSRNGENDIFPLVGPVRLAPTFRN
jgi:hypothetical protein